MSEGETPAFAQETFPNSNTDSRNVKNLVGETTPYFFSPNFHMLGENSQHTSFRETPDYSDNGKPLLEERFGFNSIKEPDKIRKPTAFNITFINSPKTEKTDSS